jgi:hypothetical protein|tara:strand:+ start:678 stop:869 length:192 start_codon:yes stop_codon:yes gene_type:complete
MKATDKAMIASYARSMVGASLALYLAGNTDPKDLLAAAIASVAPVLLRWLNPNDASYGRNRTA